MIIPENSQHVNVFDTGTYQLSGVAQFGFPGQSNLRGTLYYLSLVGTGLFNRKPCPIQKMHS